MSAKSSVKAVDYPSPDTLLQLDPHVVDALDFTGFPEKYGFKKLDGIFPKDPKYGKEDPPPHYLTAGRKIREWRKISRGNQRHAIENPPRPVVSRGSSRRADRRNRRRDVLIAADQNEWSASQLSQVVASVPLPNATPLRPASSGPSSPPALATPIVRSRPREASVPCRGISEQNISGSNLPNKADLQISFWNQYANACRVKPSYQSNHRGKWPYGANIDGFIIDPRYESGYPFCLAAVARWEGRVEPPHLQEVSDQRTRLLRLLLVESTVPVSHVRGRG